MHSLHETLAYIDISARFMLVTSHTDISARFMLAISYIDILARLILVTDRLCGLVVRVSGYRYRGLGFDSRRYQIF